MKIELSKEQVELLHDIVHVYLREFCSIGEREDTQAVHNILHHIEQEASDEDTRV